MPLDDEEMLRDFDSLIYAGKKADYFSKCHFLDDIKHYARK